MNHGGKRRVHAPRKLSHDQAREISVLISQGVQGKVIADRYNVGRRTIYAALARLETEEAMTSTYLAPDLGGRRCSDRETQLLNELDFERKVSVGLLATIDRLERELAKAKGEVK